MAVAGFDGKVRRKPPADTAWFATSFVFTFLYWLACSYVLPDRPYLLLASYGGTEWWTLVVPLIPFVVTLALSFVFRVPDRTFWTWVLLVWAAETVTGFATFLAIVVLMILGR